MKQALFTLILIFTAVTAYGQDAGQIRTELETIRQSTQRIESLLTTTPLQNFSAAWNGKAIRITWQGGTDQPIDIQYSRMGEEKVHSVQWMLEHPDYSPPALEAENGEYVLGSPPNGDWGITIGTGQWDGKAFVFDWSETILVKKKVAELPDPEEPIDVEPSDPIDAFYGYWDSRYTPADAPANVWKDWAGTVKEFSSRGKVIPMISGFAHDDRQYKIDSRINNYKTHIHDIGPEGIEFVLLHDEPYYKNFEVEQLERIVDSAKKNMGNEYKYAFTFARGNVRKSAVELPQNVDLVGLNFYPFYYQEYYPKRYITTKQEFFDFLTETVNIVRKKAPQAEIFLVGQAIQDDGEKYRQPPAEAPQWYAEFVRDNKDVIGVLWFEWRGRHSWEGVESMPDLYEKQKQAFELFQKRS